MHDSQRPTLILPDWPAPSPVQAFVTTRESGPSQGPFAGFNPALHVGDDPIMVARVRELLAAEVDDGRPLAWLDQVHGTQVMDAFEVCHGEEHSETVVAPRADACVSTGTGQACVVMTADCLPVLFCDRQGTRIGVAHAGWRGLVEGVLEATVARLGEDPGELMAWLGPAISNAQFEVGPEVREAFVADQAEAEDAFEASPYRLGHYMCDLYKLARLRLERAGVGHVSGGHFCTASEPRFYSHRRDDGVTGRLVTVIWLR